jgi:hypothetical protein
MCVGVSSLDVQSERKQDRQIQIQLQAQITKSGGNEIGI